MPSSPPLFISCITHHFADHTKISPIIDLTLDFFGAWIRCHSWDLPLDFGGILTSRSCPTCTRFDPNLIVPNSGVRNGAHVSNQSSNSQIVVALTWAGSLGIHTGPIDYFGERWGHLNPRQPLAHCLREMAWFVIARGRNHLQTKDRGNVFMKRPLVEIGWAGSYVFVWSRRVVGSNLSQVRASHALKV